VAEIRCARCGETKPALERPPYPDAMGREIAEKICADCWQECKAMQVMVINEYRLDLSDPRAHEILERSIREFLGLTEPSEA
jgi:Fe-S cluster biosynthesis and repair protein YggX